MDKEQKVHTVLEEQNDVLVETSLNKLLITHSLYFDDCCPIYTHAELLKLTSPYMKNVIGFYTHDPEKSLKNEGHATPFDTFSNFCPTKFKMIAYDEEHTFYSREAGIMANKAELMDSDSESENEDIFKKILEHNESCKSLYEIPIEKRDEEFWKKWNHILRDGIKRGCGRKVKNWNQEKWDHYVERIATKVIYTNVLQDLRFRKQLLSTVVNEKQTQPINILAECTKYDKKWGVGISIMKGTTQADQGFQNLENWNFHLDEYDNRKPNNILGRALMTVRDKML